MEIKILNKEKNEIELEISNLTIAEILRVYSNKESTTEFAAWKREHNTKNPILKIKTSGKDATKTVNEAAKAIISDLENIEKEFRTLK